MIQILKTPEKVENVTKSHSFYGWAFESLGEAENGPLHSKFLLYAMSQELVGVRHTLQIAD